MFRIPGNKFKDIKCPLLSQFGNCDVLNCLFRHEGSRKAPEATHGTKRPKIETVEADVSAPPSKVLQQPAVEVEKDFLFVVPKDLSNDLQIQRYTRLQNTKRIAKHILDKKLSATPNKKAIEIEHDLASSSSSVHGYQAKVDEYLGIKELTRRADPKFISPIEVNPSPAMLPVRRKFIEHFTDAIKKAKPECEAPILEAIEVEYEVASSASSVTYNIEIRRKLAEINNPDKYKKVEVSKPSKDDYISELRATVIPREKLVKFGYIMDFPEPITELNPLRHCRRCKCEFKLENAYEQTDCRYHEGKLIKNQTGVRIYLCCGGVLGETDTEPCTKSSHHVFYWTNPQEMHHAIPFQNTRNLWGARKGSIEAVGIDCEMGFTTNGFELLRVTAMDFISGEEVLDILVRPKGKILDLNTRWSGVAEIKEEALSFEDLITLLGEVIDCNTILVGHGLENDLNAMRLIHENVVDTAVLYPPHKASPSFRFSLKQLSFQYLSRNIQSGEHDSGEDSLAAIDVAKYFIEKELKRKKSLPTS